MPRLDYKAIVIAFVAELGADMVIQALLIALFAHDLLSGATTAEQEKQAMQTAMDSTPLAPCIFLFGMATTVVGAYLAARLARRIPYYHGLAMGVVGVVFSLSLWSADAVWYDYVGLLLTIPASIFGAHFARRHMPPESRTGGPG